MALLFLLLSFCHISAENFVFVQPDIVGSIHIFSASECDYLTTKSLLNGNESSELSVQ